MWNLVKRLPWRSMVLTLVLVAVLYGLNRWGYHDGSEDAKRDGDAALSGCSQRLIPTKPNRPRLRTQRCGPGQSGIRSRLPQAIRPKPVTLSRLLSLRARKNNYRGKLTMSHSAGLMKKVRAIPLSACLLAVSCASTTPRSDMTTHPSTPVIQTQLPPLAPALAQRPGNLKPLTPGYATQASPSVTSSPTSSTTRSSAASGAAR